ncbi:hypothetical protein ACTXT7_012148 [Hymenolepis weldensis]
MIQNVKEENVLTTSQLNTLLRKKVLFHSPILINLLLLPEKYEGVNFDWSLVASVAEWIIALNAALFGKSKNLSLVLKWICCHEFHNSFTFGLIAEEFASHHHVERTVSRYKLELKFFSGDFLEPIDPSGSEGRPLVTQQKLLHFIRKELNLIHEIGIERDWHTGYLVLCRRNDFISKH